ncbi:Hypothetical_protein [Hexamita inflata]|uniref:Hypothetical_protein n=1 Tax=Hexamita inflata TaxID=28002 RepID=A0AA86PHM7_9EUKA|nr:Hypothetical protein HINF_LOCUS23695 [Hexamita inflata]
MSKLIDPSYQNYIMQFLEYATLTLNDLVHDDNMVNYNSELSKQSVAITVMMLSKRQYITFLSEMSFYLNITMRQVDIFFCNYIASSLYIHKLKINSNISLIQQKQAVTQQYSPFNSLPVQKCTQNIKSYLQTQKQLSFSQINLKQQSLINSISLSLPTVHSHSPPNQVYYSSNASQNTNNFQQQNTQQNNQNILNQPLQSQPTFTPPKSRFDQNFQKQFPLILKQTVENGTGIKIQANYGSLGPVIQRIQKNSNFWAAVNSFFPEYTENQLKQYFCNMCAGNEISTQCNSAMRSIE